MNHLQKQQQQQQKKQSKIHTERKKINEQTPNFYSSKFQENFQKKVQK